VGDRRQPSHTMKAQLCGLRFRTLVRCRTPSIEWANRADTLGFVLTFRRDDSSRQVKLLEASHGWALASKSEQTMLAVSCAPSPALAHFPARYRTDCPHLHPLSREPCAFSSTQPEARLRKRAMGLVLAVLLAAVTSCRAFNGSPRLQRNGLLRRSLIEAQFSNDTLLRREPSK
jgi:hypothetical protein